MRLTFSIGALVLAAGLAGCAGSAPTRYHTIDGIAPLLAPGAEPVRAYDGPAIEVRSVQVPPTMDRLEMIRDTAPGAIDIREFDHWAAPLGRLARQALTEDLALRLPPDRVVFPGAAASAPAGVTVDVLSFRIEGGAAKMVVSWALRSPATASGSKGAASDNPGANAGESLRIETPATETADDTAKAWSGLLAQVSQRIVLALTRR